MMKALNRSNLTSWTPLVEEVALNYAGDNSGEYEDAVQNGMLRLMELVTGDVPLPPKATSWKPEHVYHQVRNAIGGVYREEATLPQGHTSESDIVLHNDDGSRIDGANEVLALLTVSLEASDEWMSPIIPSSAPQFELSCGHTKGLLGQFSEAFGEKEPYAMCPSGCGEMKVGKQIKTVEGEPFVAHEREPLSGWGGGIKPGLDKNPREWNVSKEVDIPIGYDNSRDRDLDPNWLNTFGSFEDFPDYSDGLGPGPNSPLSYLPPTHEQCTGDKRTARMNEWYAAIEGEEKGRYYDRSDFQVAKVKALLTGQGPWFANVLAYAKTFPYRGPALPVKAIRGSGLALEDGSSISLAKAWRCWTGLRFGSPERTEKFCALLEEHFPSNKDAQNISRALRSK